MKGDKEGKTIRRGEIERGIGNHAQLYPLTDVSYSQHLDEVIWYGMVWCCDGVEMCNIGKYRRMVL